MKVKNLEQRYSGAETNGQTNGQTNGTNGHAPLKDITNNDSKDEASTPNGAINGEKGRDTVVDGH